MHYHPEIQPQAVPVSGVVQTSIVFPHGVALCEFTLYANIYRLALWLDCGKRLKLSLYSFEATAENKKPYVGFSAFSLPDKLAEKLKTLHRVFSIMSGINVNIFSKTFKLILIYISIFYTN